MRYDPRVSYENWLAWVFDHPPVQDWYWKDEEFPGGDTDWPYTFDLEEAPAEAAKLLTYMTRLFNAPCEPMANFTLAQVGQGYWFLASGCWGCARTITDLRLPETDRLACVRAMETLYRGLFAEHCAPTLSHLESSENPLNVVCYMWWDLLPWGDYEDLVRPDGAPAEDEDDVEFLESRVVPEKLAQFRLLHLAMLETLREILRIDHLACREGALHGLGHLQELYPHEVSQIVQEFLYGEKALPAELIIYAEAAAEGAVQ